MRPDLAFIGNPGTIGDGGERKYTFGASPVSVMPGPTVGDKLGNESPARRVCNDAQNAFHCHREVSHMLELTERGVIGIILSHVKGIFGFVILSCDRFEDRSLYSR